MKRWIFGSLLLLSVGFNVYFLMGKGIQITNHYKQYQNQQQAQLVLGLHPHEGHIEWHVAKPADPMEFLNALPPEQALFAKCDRMRVIYPTFVKGGEKSVMLPPPAPKRSPFLERVSSWKGSSKSQRPFVRALPDPYEEL